MAHDVKLYPNKDYVIQLPDNLGVNKFIIKDSNGSTVCTINSNGAIDTVSSIEMDAGQKLYLENAGNNTYITYNSGAGYVDFVVGASSIMRIDSTGVLSNANGVIEGDATSGRVCRVIELSIKDGTNASTLKCEVISSWNGDTISQTDNISKGSLTGDFYLNSVGTTLIIEASGLSGSVVMAFGTIYYNSTGTSYDVNVYSQSNDIQVNINDFSGVNKDITTLVDSGEIYIRIIYLTDT